MRGGMAYFGVDDGSGMGRVGEDGSGSVLRVGDDSVIYMLG